MRVRAWTVVSLLSLLLGCASSRPVEVDESRTEIFGQETNQYEDFVRGRSGIPSGGAGPSPEATLESAAGTLELHFVNVGQGDATLIVCPNGRRILVDAGSLSDFDEETVRDYILEMIDPDDPRIDVLIVTHADQDHYNLLAYVLAGVDVGHIFHVGADSHYNSSFRTWLNGFNNNDVTKLGSTDFDPEGHPNDEIDCGATDIFILAADIRSSFSWKNTRSVVVMLRYGEFEAILTGDATKDTEAAILSRYDHSFLDADVLKMGHHGSSYTSTTDVWVLAVTPEVSIASAGWRNSHGHPRKEIVDRLVPHAISWEPHLVASSTGSRRNYVWHDVELDKAIFNTATNGTVVVVTKGEGDYEISWFDYND